LALDADKFGPIRVAVVLQPVGVGQPRRIICGILQDGRQESTIVHGTPSIWRPKVAVAGHVRSAMTGRCGEPTFGIARHDLVYFPRICQNGAHYSG
jgi:hypothetical protein